MRKMRMMGALLAALVMGGCAGHLHTEEPGTEAEVVVENDGTIASLVRVYLIPVSGTLVSLGTMSTMGVETLAIPGPVLPGQYRFRAESGTGRFLTSPVFQLRPGDTVVWEMRLNRVRQQ
jgi:hypothetical protein